jgi:hypothetical protein
MSPVREVSVRGYAPQTPDGMSFDGTECTGARMAGSMEMLTGSGNSQSWTNLSVEENGRVTASNQQTKTADGNLQSYPFIYT